jgi:ATP phosphoribosyltransferase
MTLRIAIPNKGALSDAATSIMKDAGYRQRGDSRDLAIVDPENDLEFYYLRPRDIAVYVASGELDGGITGRDLLSDSGLQARELLALDFGRSALRFAAPQEAVDQGNMSESTLAGKRIATAYPNLLQSFLQRSAISATVVPLDGAVEGAIKLGVADLIADVVATGSTLRQAGLRVFGEPILESEAVLIGNSQRSNNPALETLIRRLSGVVIARQYVLVDYDVKKADLERACAITPGLESPTISPLANENWAAVRAMVKRRDVHAVMDQLWDLGARGILVTDIHSCRL